MAEVNAKDVFDILLESLKIQADKYKSIVNQDLTHEQRKDFDSEIKQMFELLTSMTNSSTVYTLSEIQALKLQYEVKIQELQTTLDNIDVTTVKGDTGANGIDGQNGADGTNGIDGKDFTYDMFTPEQLELLKGADGQNGVDGTNGQNGIDGKDFTYDMFTPEQLELLKGADGQNGADGINGQNGIDGKDFTYDMFTPEQLQQIANLVTVQTVDLTSILSRLVAIETLLNIAVAPEEPTTPTVQIRTLNSNVMNLEPDNLDNEIIFSFNSTNDGNSNNNARFFMTNIPADSIDNYLTVVLGDVLPINSHSNSFTFDYSYVWDTDEATVQGYNFAQNGERTVLEDLVNPYVYSAVSCLIADGKVCFYEILRPEIIDLNKNYIDWTLGFSLPKGDILKNGFVLECQEYNIEQFIMPDYNFDYPSFMASIRV